MAAPPADFSGTCTANGLQQMDHQPRSRPGWWVERPSLEYQHAFDLVALEVHREGGDVAVFASSSFYARELLKRLQGIQVRFFPVGDGGSQARDLHGWSGPAAASSGSLRLESKQSFLRAAVWAEPEWERAQEVLAWLGQILLPGNKLYVIASSWLSRFLPEWTRPDDHPAQHRTGFLRTSAWLRRAGFVFERLYGFHGPQSVLWGYASRWMALLGRGDWADRCHFQMRDGYVVSGWQSLLTPVVLSVVRRG